MCIEIGFSYSSHHSFVKNFKTNKVRSLVYKTSVHVYTASKMYGVSESKDPARFGQLFIFHLSRQRIEINNGKAASLNRFYYLLFFIGVECLVLRRV